VANLASYGGGIARGILRNCTVFGNWASIGGGAYYATLYNCTVAGNSAGYMTGGTYKGTNNNCIIYYNMSQASEGNYYSSMLNYCCTTPLSSSSSASGNITNAPLFVDQAGNLRLQTNSPCINAGLNTHAPVGPDLDGNPRIMGGTVDIGAYEFQFPASVISYAWLQRYGLPAYGSADYTDSDQDGMNNWQEWRAGTDPTNAASAFRMRLELSGVNLRLIFTTQPGKSYSVERTGSLTPPIDWESVPGGANLSGTGAELEINDPDGTNLSQKFYRVSSD
jgi:hypothetical protein